MRGDVTIQTLRHRRYLAARQERQTADATLADEAAERAAVAHPDTRDPLERACIARERARAEELRLAREIDGLRPTRRGGR